LVLAQAASAIEIAGIHIEDEATIAAQKLVLNGAGIRYRFGFQIYTCALYLPQKRSTLKDILALPGPKRVSVTMLREISNDELGDALMNGIRKNSTPDDTRGIGLQLVKLGELFSTIPRLKKGDSFTLDFNPEVGTLISVNGKPVLDPLPDPAFFAALLRIWLGENAVDSALKPRLLGVPDDPFRSMH
jgi:hypothetical protein